MKIFALLFDIGTGGQQVFEITTDYYGGGGGGVRAHSAYYVVYECSLNEDSKFSSQNEINFLK